MTKNFFRFIISPLRQHTLQGVDIFVVGILITLLNENIEIGTKSSADVSWHELQLNSICDNIDRRESYRRSSDTGLGYV